MYTESTYEPTIIRTPHNRDNPYFMMTRAAAQDESLSWSARGLMAYLLSKPNHWRVLISDLQQKCGRDKVYSILNELIDAGYMTRETKQKGKRAGTTVEYQVHETPQLKQHDHFPAFQDTDFQDTENPLLDSIEKTGDKKEKREKSARPKSAQSNGRNHIEMFEAANNGNAQKWLDTWHDALTVPPAPLNGNSRVNALEQVEALQAMGYTLETWREYIQWRESKKKTTTWRFSVDDAHTWMAERLAVQQNQPKPAPKAFQPQYIKSENVTMILVNGQYQYVPGDQRESCKDDQRAAYAVTGENEHE